MQLSPWLILVAALLVGGCAASPSKRESFDHVVVGIKDLDRGVNDLADLTGVKAAYGGQHPELGTHNALISLGSGQYLEVLAPRAGAQLTDQLEFLRQLDRLTPAAWAVQTSNAQDTIAMLHAAGYGTSKPVEGSRAKPDGSLLRWKLFFITTPQIQMVPFFIEWAGETIHPAATSPTGCELASLELSTPEYAHLKSLLRILNVPALVEERERGAMTLTLTCGGRMVRVGD